MQDTGVSTAYIVTWFTTFDCNGVMCPCCSSEVPLVPYLLKPAPPIVLEDVNRDNIWIISQ